MQMVPHRLILEHMVFTERERERETHIKVSKVSMSILELHTALSAWWRGGVGMIIFNLSYFGPQHYRLSFPFMN